MSKYRYYHGGSKKHKIGTCFEALCPKKTEFSSRKSGDGIYIEDFVDSFRPRMAPSRTCAMYSVPFDKPVNLKKLSKNLSLLKTEMNMLGVDVDDFIYEVEPFGKTVFCNFWWFGELLGNYSYTKYETANEKWQRIHLGSKNILGNKTAEKLAINYWKGIPAIEYEGRRPEGYDLKNQYEVLSEGICILDGEPG